MPWEAGNFISHLTALERDPTFSTTLAARHKFIAMIEVYILAWLQKCKISIHMASQYPHTCNIAIRVVLKGSYTYLDIAILLGPT